jgi:hypothetical protein
MNLSFDASRVSCLDSNRPVPWAASHLTQQNVYLLAIDRSGHLLTNLLANIAIAFC